MLEAQLVDYLDSYWNQLNDFIIENYKPDHPLVNRTFFEWYYRGFGKNKAKNLSKLLIYNSKIIGFRGIIPVEFRLPVNEKVKIVQGGSFAMWMVHADFQGKGLGFKMFSAIDKEFSALYTAGSNRNTSVPIYRKNGFSELDAFYRYIIPLKSEYYKLTNLETLNSDLYNWLSNISESIRETDLIESKPVEPERMANCFQRNANRFNWLSLNRTAEYYRWRYNQSKGFIYFQFGEPEVNGAVIARIESVLSDNPELDSIRLLRIIELLPAKPEQLFEDKSSFSDLLKKVIKWSVINNIVAIDFQCSNSIFESTLTSLFFRKQSFENTVTLTSLANLFQPLDLRYKPINAYWKLRDERGNIVSIDSENTYFIKSDSDTDRPNLCSQLQ